MPRTAISTLPPVILTKSKTVTARDRPDFHTDAIGERASKTFGPIDESSTQQVYLAMVFQTYSVDFSMLDEVDGRPFSGFELLKSRTGHFAVFLHYLLSNSDPAVLVRITVRCFKSSNTLIFEVILLDCWLISKHGILSRVQSVGLWDLLNVFAQWFGEKYWKSWFYHCT